jgi:single-strand selective monofunctional uracil DNA glycosylase
VIGVGSFACKRAQVALAGLDVAVGTILHPSPASPLANRGWAAAASRQLAALGIVAAVDEKRGPGNT